MSPQAMLWGEVRGEVVTRWLRSQHEDRRMVIHPDTSLIFVRPGREVIAPRVGMEFDGASIPPLFWVLFGSPFTGKYRLAAVIHDHLCAVQDRPYRQAHYIMYEAMRALGVGRIRAKLIYWALLIGGSKW